VFGNNHAFKERFRAKECIIVADLLPTLLEYLVEKIEEVSWDVSDFASHEQNLERTTERAQLVASQSARASTLGLPSIRALGRISSSKYLTALSSTRASAARDHCC